MSEAVEDRRKRGERERHLQTVALACITAGLLWVGSTMREMYDNQLKQQVTMAEMSTQIKDVRQQLATLPTQREIDARFDGVTRRVDALERRP